METEEDEEARKLRLRINFQQEIITLSKEVRNLKWLGFRVPLTIINKAHQANQVIFYCCYIYSSKKGLTVFNHQILALPVCGVTD